MKKIDLGFAVFSLLTPLLVYSSVPVLFGPASGRSFILLASNVIGFALSVMVLARSGRQMLDTSSSTRFVLLLATIGIFANTVAFQITLFFHPAAL